MPNGLLMVWGANSLAVLRLVLHLDALVFADVHADANVDGFVVDDADALVDAGAKSHKHLREQIAYCSCGMRLHLCWCEVVWVIKK